MPEEANAIPIIPTEKKVNSRFGLLLSDGLLIALLSAVGYLLAYAYGLGRLHYYHLPYYFLEITPQSLIQSVIATYLGVIALAQPVWNAWHFQGPLEKRIFLTLGVYLTILSFRVFFSPGVELIVFAAFGVWVLYLFCAPMSTKKEEEKSLTYINKLRNYEERTKKLRSARKPVEYADIHGFLERTTGLPAYRMYIVGLLLSLCAYRVGYLNAKNESDYIAVEYKDGTRALLVQKLSESTFLGMEVTRKNISTGKIHMLDIQDQSEVLNMTILNGSTLRVLQEE